MTYILIVDQQSNPNRHPTLESAKIEAERLCKKEKKYVFVYELIGETRPKESPVEFISYKSE